MRSLHDPWTIGDLEIPNRVMLAPLAGIGNWFVRLQAKRYGAGLAVSEMISSFAIHYGNAKTLNELLVVHPDEGPVAIQLFGHDPEIMRSAAAEVARVGASILDLNMGCPVPKVMKTGAGRGDDQGPRPRRSRSRAPRARAPGCRSPSSCGRRSRPGGMEGLELARRLVDEAGVAGITFHPRSAAVRHKGVPDYDLARRAGARAAGPGDRQRRDGGRRAHPLGLRAHGLRGGHAGAWRTREPVAVRPGAGRARATSRRAEEVLAEWHWVIDRAEEHLGPDRAARYLRKFHPWYVERLGAPKAVQDALQRAETLG